MTDKSQPQLDIRRVRSALNIARNSSNTELQNTMGKLMSSSTAARSLANLVVHGKRK